MTTCALPASGIWDRAVSRRRCPPAGALHWFWDRRGYLDEGRGRIHAALDAAAHVGDAGYSLLRGRAWALVGAAALAFDQGDRAAVAIVAEESVTLFRQLDDRSGLTLALLRLAFVASASEPERARDLLAEAIEHARAAGDPWFVGLALFVSAQAAIFGMGDTLAARACATEAVPALKASGDPYRLGHAMATLGLVDRADGNLTDREVAALIAQGTTNRPIAEALIISERTVERHVANMFAKLDVGSRTQIAAFAVQEGLTHPSA